MVDEEAIEFAKKVTASVFRRFKLGFVEYRDIQAMALLGLCQAATHFKPGTGACLKTYAYPRIHGEILDFVRAELNSKKAAAKMTVHGVLLLQLQNKSPEEIVYTRRLTGVLSQLLGKLPSDEKNVVYLHYYEDKTFSEIGGLMGGRSKTWVARLHSRAMESLRTGFAETLRLPRSAAE
jgi:RNA polymerase sigma factor (sigma-70 family)